MEHERFGRPANLRPRTAGPRANRTAASSACASAAQVADTQRQLHSTTIVADATAQRSSLAASSNDDRKLQQRLQMPSHPLRPKEVPVTGILLERRKPPARPKSAVVVNRLRMERLSAFPCNQLEGANSEATTTESTKLDESRYCAKVETATIMERPLSATATIATKLVRSAAGLKRPISAFSGLRPKFHRHGDSKLALSQTAAHKHPTLKPHFSGPFPHHAFAYAVPVHCVHPSHPYNPYDIVSIPHGELFGSYAHINQLNEARYDFYTVSMNGFTYHVKEDGFQATFLSSTDWKRQKEQFDQIRKLSTFILFRYRKVFLAWKKWVRNSKFEAARVHLLSTLYFSSVPLLLAMRDVRLEMTKLGAIQLMWDFEGKTTTLEDFVIYNSDHLREQGAKIKEIHSAIQDILLRVCQECLNSLETPHGIVPGHQFGLSTRKSSNSHIFDSYIEQQISLATADAQLVRRDHMTASPPKLSVLQQQKAHRAIFHQMMAKKKKRNLDALEEIRWTMAAIRRRKCAHIANFVRLIDFILVDALSEVIFRSVEMVNHLLTSGANGVQIAQLMSRPDYFMAFHRTFQSCRAEKSGTGTFMSSKTSESDHIYLTRHQVKKFLRKAWHGKLQRNTNLSDEKTMTSVWVESKLEDFFFCALDNHFGSNIDKYSMDDLLSIVENAMAQTIVLPLFHLESCSIYKEVKHDLESPELPGISPVVPSHNGAHDIQSINCFAPIPLFYINLDLINDNSVCKVKSRPELLEVATVIGDAITGFGEIFKEIPALSSRHDLQMIFEFARSIQPFEMVEAMAKPDSDNDEDENSNSNDTAVASVHERLMERLGDSHCYSHARVNIENVIADALDGAEAFIECYSNVSKLHMQNEEINFEVLKIKFRNDQYSLANMAHDLKSFNEQICALDMLSTTQQISFIEFDMNHLKNALLPSPAECLKTLHKLLPSLALERCETLLSFVRDSAKKIAKPVVAHLQQFTQYLLYVEDVNYSMEQNELELAFLANFFRTLEQMSIQIPAQTLALYELCMPEFEALKVAVNEAIICRDSDIVAYSPILTEAIHTLYLDIDSLKDKSNDQSMHALDTSCYEARELATQLNAQSNLLCIDSTQLLRTQKVFANVHNATREPIDAFPELETLSNELKLKKKLWEAICDAEGYLESKSAQTLREINLDNMRQVVTELEATVDLAYNSSFCMAALTRLENAKDTIEGLMPVIRDLRNEHLHQDHWTKLEHKLQCSWTMSIPADLQDAGESCNVNEFFSSLHTTKTVANLDLPFHFLLDINAIDHASAIHQVSEEATAEAAITSSFESVLGTWECKEIPLMTRRDRDGRDSLGIGECSDILSLLEESEILLRVMDFSSYARIIQAKLARLLSDLAQTKESMDLLVVCQQKWELMQRLVSIDFLRAYPDASRMLQKHEAMWKALMESLTKRSVCLTFGISAENRQIVQTIVHAFEAIYKTLVEHLEVKRISFPILFKLSNFELATLLSKARDINNIQPFLHLCFDNVGKINFGVREAFQDVISVSSRVYPEEVVQMGKNLKARGSPELWLSAIEKRLAEQMRKLTKDVLEILNVPGDCEDTDDRELSQFPLQSIILADEIHRCDIIHKGIHDNQTHGFSAPINISNIHHQLHEYQQSLLRRAFGPLDAIDEKKMTTRHWILRSCMALQEIRFRDAVSEHFLSVQYQQNPYRQLTSGTEWALQLKYVFDDTNAVGFECHVESSGWRTPYGFNYTSPHAEIVLNPSSIRYLYSLFACIRGAQACVLKGDKSCGKSSLARQINHIMGRHHFFAQINPAFRLSHATKLVRGALHSGGTFCLQVTQLTTDALEIISSLVSLIRKIEHAAQFKLPIKGLQDDPISFISGTAFIFTIQGTRSEKLDTTTAWTQLCHFEILQQEEAYILEALLYSKQFGSPKALASRLMLIIDHSRTRKEWMSLFSLRVMKRIIIATERKFRCNTEVYEKSRLQSFLLRDELLRHSQLLLEAEAYEMLSITINTVFQNEHDSREWFVKQWHREQVNREVSVPNGLQIYLEQAAEHYRFLPRQSLWDSGLKIAEAVTTHVGVIITGQPGSGKTTSYQVLMKALSLARHETIGNLHDLHTVSAASKIEPQKLETDPSLYAKGGMRFLSMSTSKSEPPKACVNEFTVTNVILPMALSLTQLYGTTCQDGKGRTQSIFGCLLRNAQETSGTPKHDINDSQQFKKHNPSISNSLLAIFEMEAFHLVVFDGCFNQLWTETLMCILGRKHTVLAMDNSEEVTRRELFFEDGEFMSVPPNLRFAFESLTLENASPSMIAMNAIVYLDDNRCKTSSHKSKETDITIPMSHLRRSIQHHRKNASESSMESSFVDTVFDHVSEWLLKTDIVDSLYAIIEEYKPSVHLSQLQRVTYLQSLLSSLLHTISVIHSSESCRAEVKQVSHSPNVTSDPLLVRIQMAIIYALMWGFACCTSENVSLQLLLNEWIKKRFDSISSSWTKGASSDINLLNTILDLTSMRFVDVSMARIKSDTCTSQQKITSYPNIFIPTASSVLIHSVMKEVMRTDHGVLLVGCENARRTTLLRNFLGQVNSQNIQSAELSSRCSSRRKSAPSTLTEPSHHPISEIAESSTSSLDRIRFHQVSLVSLLATKFKRLASAHKEAPVLSSTHSSLSGTEEANSSTWMIMPTISPKRNEMINKFDQGEFIPFFVSLNRHDSGVGELSKCLERVLQRERTGVYEPPPGKTVILIIDDLHLPVLSEDDNYQSCHEYLRSVYEHSVVYANDNAKKITIEGLMLTCSIATESMPGYPARQMCDHKQYAMDKLVRQLFPVLAHPLSLQELHQIFSARVVSEWENPKPSGTRLIQSVQEILPLIIAGTIVLWEKLRQTMSSQQVAQSLQKQTDKAQRMTLNLHDLARVYDGLCYVESSFLVDSAILIRLWNHECLRSFADPSPFFRMSIHEIAHEIFRMRSAIETMNQSQGKITAAEATSTISSSINDTLLSVDKKSLADLNVNAEKRLSAFGLLATLAAEFLEKYPSKAEVKARSGSKTISHQLHNTQASMWSFVQSRLYYQATSQESNQNMTKERKPRDRQSSINFIRQKSMDGARNNRWIYAELLEEDTIPEYVDVVDQIFFSAMQTFSTVHASEYRVGSSLSITSHALQVPSDAPKIPHSMAQKIARITRSYFPPSAKLILLGPNGSGREAILQYVLSERKSEQYQRILMLEAIPSTHDTLIMWKMLLNELYERIGVECENITLILKRIDLFPACMVSQLLSLMSSGEIPGAFSLDEQINLATRVRDERLVEIENQYQLQVAQIRRASELRREEELAVIKKAEKETKQAQIISQYEAYELQSQQELNVKLAQLDLRFQQDCDDFYRKCEVENESLSANIMSLMRPLGMTSGKWQQIIDRLRKRLRIVCMVDTENYVKTLERIPELFRVYSTISLPPMDEESIRVILHGHFHAEMQHLRRIDFLSIGKNAVASMSDELAGFLENVGQALPQLSRVAAAMHLAAMKVASRSKTVVHTRLACIIPTFFTRLLRHHYLHYVKLQLRSEAFLQSFLDMELELWKLRSGDDEARARVVECDRKILLYTSLLLEQQQRANQLRDMKCRFQAAAEEQVTVSNEMERQSQVELHVPLACLEEANAALLLIEKKHIVELKSFNSPPPLVHLVLDAICVMFGIEPAWENARKILSDTNVVQTMLHYDKDSIPNDLLSRVEQEYIRDTRFLREEVEKQSVAASMMVVWVRAIYQYASTRRLVLPTLEKLEKAQSRLKLLMREFQVSQQRLEEADALVLQSQTEMEECVQSRQKAVEDIESRASRLESGKMSLEFLTEDKVEMESLADNLKQQRLNGLLWWNALLDAGLMAYGGLFNILERNELFKAWGEACLSFGALKTSPKRVVSSSSIPTIRLMVANQDENDSEDEGDASDSQFCEDNEDTSHLFYRHYEWSWKIVSSSGSYFSSKRLQDTYILSMAAFSAFPVVMITSYTHEIEELLVKCARNLWKWKDFLMINSKADDFENVFVEAVRNGHQLLVLDVEPLDGECTHGKVALAFQWETSIVNGIEHLNIHNKSGKEKSPIIDRTELIPIHASFRLVLASHETRYAFGEAILAFPVLDARIHASDVANVILDAMWNPGIFAGQECFSLKMAVRDYELLTQKHDEVHNELKVLIQEAAKQGDFKISAMEVLREKCNATKESRLKLQQKRADIESQTYNVKSSKKLAQLGAAIFNSFNTVVTDKSTQSSPAMTLQTFLPMFLSTLKQPADAPPSRHEPHIPQNAASIVTRPSVTPQLSSRASSLIRQSSRVIELQQGSVRMLSTKPMFFNSTPVITKQMLMNIMPLISSQCDWDRFVLNVMWNTEVTQSLHRRRMLCQPDLSPKPAEGENTEFTGHDAVLRLGTIASVSEILTWKKLTQWNDSSCPSDILAHRVQGISDGEQKLLSQVVTGVVAQNTSHDKELLASNRARPERIKIGISLFPHVYRGLCDKLLEINGVQLSFTRDTTPPDSIQPGNDDSDQSDSNRSHGWLKALAPFPEMSCVLFSSKHAFNSFEFLHHLFFRTIFTPDVQLAVLKEHLTRSYRVFENLEDFYVLPKNILLQPLVTQNRPLARAMNIHPVVNIMLMIKSFDQIMQMEHSKIDVLESAPLAIVGMQNDRNPIHWEELFHILHRKVRQTASTTFRRHDSVDERRHSVGRRKSKQQTETGSSSPVLLRNAPSSRRMSTTRSILHRHSDLDLMTPSYPRLVSVVQDWRVLPIHLQKNLLCLHDADEPRNTDSVSFKNTLQSTMLRFVYHACMGLLQDATDETSKSKTGVSIRLSDPSSQPGLSIWQLLSSLVLFHSLLQIRSQLQAQCYQHLGTPFAFYTLNTFVTALNALLRAFLQGKSSKSSRNALKGSSERYIHQVVLNVYIQQAVGTFELEFLERMYHECTEIVHQSRASAASEDKSVSRTPSFGQGTSSPRLVLPVQSSFSIDESRRTLLQVKRSNKDVASRRPLIAPWLLAPLESALTYPVTNVEEWVEVWWICAEQIDERSMRQQLSDLFGLRALNGSGSQDLSFAPTVPDWVERFGWETLPAQGEGDFAKAVARTDALDVIHVVHALVPQQISVERHGNPITADQEPGMTDYHALVDLVQQSCVKGFNDRIARFQRLLDTLIDALTSENMNESGRDGTKASLQEVEPLKIQQQLLAIMQNQIPPGLLSPRDALATSHWSLDDLVAFYSSWHATIASPARQDSPWTLWLPALLFVGFPTSYLLEIAKQRYCRMHKLDPSEQETSFTLQTQQQLSVGANYTANDRSNVASTQDARSSSMATCFAVFEGMSLSGAIWDSDRACLSAGGFKEPRQRVLVLCLLTLKGNARLDDSDGRKIDEIGLDRKLSTRSCPFITVHDFSSVVSYEFMLPAASDLPVLATPILIPSISTWASRTVIPL